MGYALSLKCPECGFVDEHKVVHTESAPYRWSDEHTRLFKQLWGRDISFRKRLRYCRSCQNNFDTAEIDVTFLSCMVEGIDQLRNTVKWYQSHMRYYTEGPGAIALFRAAVGLEKVDEQRCFQLLPEIVDAIREIIEVLPPEAQMLVSEHYGVRISDVSNTDAGTGDELNIEKVLEMLRDPSRGASLKPLLDKVQGTRSMPRTRRRRMNSHSATGTTL